MRPFVTLLLWLPGHLIWNFFRFATGEHWIKNLILLTFALGVGWAEWMLFDRFWQILGRIPFGYQITLPNLFSYTGTFLFFFLAYSSVLTTLSALYKSRELPLLLVSPIRLEIILLYKWCEIAIRSAITLVALMIPLWLSLGFALNQGLLYYLGFFGLILCLTAMAVSLGVVIALVLMMLFPVKRLNQTLAIFGLIVAAFLIFAIRLLNLETLWSEQALQNPMVAFLRQEPNWWVQHGPGQLFANAMLPLLFGQREGYGWAAMAAFLAAGAIGVCLTFGRFVMMPGWWKNQEQQDPTLRRQGRAQTRWIEWLPLKRKHRAMLWKDWVILTRDPSIWTQLLMMLPLAAMYLVNLLFLPQLQGGVQPFFAAANVGLIGLIVAAIGARFVFPTISREGLSAWIPFVAPIKSGDLFVQKALFVLPPVWGVSLFMLAISCWILNLSGSLLNWSYAFGFILIALISLQALALGAWFPQFRFQNIMEVSLGKGAILFMVLALFQASGLVYAAVHPLLAGHENQLPFLSGLMLAWICLCGFITLGVIGGGCYRLANPNTLS